MATRGDSEREMNLMALTTPDEFEEWQAIDERMASLKSPLPPPPVVTWNQPQEEEEKQFLLWEQSLSAEQKTAQRDYQNKWSEILRDRANLHQRIIDRLHAEGNPRLADVFRTYL